MEGLNQNDNGLKGKRLSARPRGGWAMALAIEMRGAKAKALRFGCPLPLPLPSYASTTTLSPAPRFHCMLSNFNSFIPFFSCFCGIWYNFSQTPTFSYAFSIQTTCTSYLPSLSIFLSLSRASVISHVLENSSLIYIFCLTRDFFGTSLVRNPNLFDHTRCLHVHVQSFVTQ